MTPSSKNTLFAVVALAAMAVGAWVWSMAPMAPELDLSLAKKSAAGIYQVTLEPETTPLKQNELQAFMLTLKTAAGAPVDDALISVDGGMPAHNHGLPTAPKATASLGDGRYRIEGVKFSMSGHWELRFAISASAGADAVTFNLLL